MKRLPKLPISEKLTVPSRFVGAALCLGSLALSTVCLLGGAAQAQVQVSPMLIELQANRGQSDGVIEIANRGNKAFRARVYVQPFTYSDKGFETLPSSSNDLTPYLQFSPRELNVPANTNRRIRFIARLAPNLPDGEYRAVVFTENLEEQKVTNQQGNTFNIKTRIGTTVYVRKGNVSPKLGVDNASFNNQARQVQLLIRNAGQASARPSVNWQMKQGERVVQTGTVNPSAIISQTQRNLLLDFSIKDKNIAPGNYQLVGELVVGEGTNSRSIPFNVNVAIPAVNASSGK
ncbi:MAG: P pilus assembly protein, chaperone PapD [Nostocaceae cyanobacterium]|nr:P pilus assembly protein, chaperone PapD [Nostocaceae cyanobacterium]